MAGIPKRVTLPYISLTHNDLAFSQFPNKNNIALCFEHWKMSSPPWSTIPIFQGPIQIFLP